jgi:hypothetical protein
MRMVDAYPSSAIVAARRRIFGLRYLARDLPADGCARIDAPAFVSDLDYLAGKHRQASLCFDLCIARRQRPGPGSGLPDG